MKKEIKNLGGKPICSGMFKQNNPNGKYDLDHWHKVFVETADLAEYTAAIKLAGSWEEWNRIKSGWPLFRRTILPGWLEEVEVKLRSEAIQALIAQSKGEKGTVAAKWLAEGRYAVRGPGKPTKAEVQREARIAANVTDEVADDYSRVSDLLPERLN